MSVREFYNLVLRSRQSLTSDISERGCTPHMSDFCLQSKHRSWRSRVLIAGSISVVITHFQDPQVEFLIFCL